MVATLAQKPIADQLKAIARDFLDSLRNRDYDYIWHYLIAEEATRLLSIALFPICVYKEGRIDQLLIPALPDERSPNLTEGMALAFQMDAEGIRSGFFDGIASSLEQTGWYEFSISEGKGLAFTEGDKAVLLAETPGVPLVIPFVVDPNGQYKVDLEALAVFSMYVSASVLYKIAVRALELDRKGQALSYFEVAASLEKPYRRLRQLLLENTVCQQMITSTRKDELRAEEKYTWLARDQVLRLLSSPEKTPIPVDMHKLMVSTFRGYDKIPQTELTDTDIKTLFEFRDKALRKAVASILMGVDPVVAQREADKPHSAAEIADMELPIIINDKLYYLCLPFKSGVEITTNSVPVEISYQILRPFMFFPNNCIVVFISAKPCSQHLLNYVKAARATQGWGIEVIEHTGLAKLLKVNGLLVN